MKIFNLFKTLFLLLVLVSLLSCIGGMPAPESSDDTLLVVLSENHAQGGVKIFYYYDLKIENSDKEIMVTPKKEFCITNGLPPGEYNSVSFALKGYNVPGYNMSGNLPPAKNVKVPAFELKPGYITIFPVKFIYEVKMSANGDTRSSFDFVAISDEEIIGAITRLSEQDGFSEWKNDFGL